MRTVKSLKRTVFDTEDVSSGVKGPCPSCTSSDAFHMYDDGHGHCFSCNHHVNKPRRRGDTLLIKEEPDQETDNYLLRDTSKFKSIPSRNLKEDVCRHFDYRVGTYKGKPVQLAYYHDLDTQQPIAVKVRHPEKTFTFLGDTKKVSLYGQWKCRDGGKLLVVTEGEIDCLSVSQVQGMKWPVVSVPNGASGAEKAIRKHIDFVNKFETVVFMFDMDDPGRDAALKCAALLPPGKAKIANLTRKDPNELLKAGEGSLIVDAIWSARTYRPDGILSANDLWNVVCDTSVVPSVPYTYEGLNGKTHGIRKKELVLICAGSGIGKSLLCKEIAYDLLINKQWKVGYIALEEDVRTTLNYLLGFHLNVPLHISRDDVKEEQIKEAFDAVTPNLYLYNAFGSIDTDNLIERLRYLAVGMQCDALFLDHISMTVSGMEDIDERRALDVMMTRLRVLVEETGIALFVVSHLKRPSNTNLGHEQGLQTSLAQLRGSAAIGQLSDIVIGLERNQQGENPDETTIRVLKNRFTGKTGEAGTLSYSSITGRLKSFDETIKEQKFEF